ncbi:MAG: hypothetical protein LBD75_03920 [Candidatus Peribacteria bacterium]|nr:hypothetical protein [Candidatus Peribacteria bacterium]
MLTLPEVPTEYQQDRGEGEEIASEFSVDTSVEPSNVPIEQPVPSIEEFNDTAEQPPLL